MFTAVSNYGCIVSKSTGLKRLGGGIGIGRENRVQICRASLKESVSAQKYSPTRSILKRCVGTIKVSLQLNFGPSAICEGGWRCCQTNANSSPFSQTRSVSGREEASPLGESGGTVQLEMLSAVEAALLVEMIMHQSMDSRELL